MNQELIKQLSDTKAELAKVSEEFAVKTKQFAELEAKVKALETSLAESEKLAKEANEKATAFAKEKRSIEIAGKVEGLINSGKLSPAQKPMAIALLETGLVPKEVKFSVGDKEYKSADELLFALIESGAGVKLNTTEQTEAGRAKRDDQGSEVGIEIDVKVREYMEKHKVSYKEAYTVISREAKAK